MQKGIVLVNTSIIGSFVTPSVTIMRGFTGAIVFTSTSGNDPALTRAEVSLKLGGLSGSGYITANSSKVLATNSLFAPFYFPAGEYVLRTFGGTSVVNAFCGIYPVDS